MGLQFGGGSELQYPEDENIPQVSFTSNFTQKIDWLPWQSPYSDSNDSLSQELSKPGRVWTKADRQDLKKFSHMITDFLQVPQFALNQKLFTTHVIEPLMCMSGPIPGAIQVLTQVMESIMIRHQYVHIAHYIEIWLCAESISLGHLMWRRMFFCPSFIMKLSC